MKFIKELLVSRDFLLMALGAWTAAAVVGTMVLLFGCAEDLNKPCETTPGPVEVEIESTESTCGSELVEVFESLVLGDTEASRSYACEEKNYGSSSSTPVVLSDGDCLLITEVEVWAWSERHFDAEVYLQLIDKPTDDAGTCKQACVTVIKTISERTN